MIDYRGYTGVIEFDDELEIFSGHVIGLNDTIYFEGRDAAELKQSMHEAVDRLLRVVQASRQEPGQALLGQVCSSR